MSRFLDSFSREMTGAQRLFAYVVTIAALMLIFVFFSKNDYVVKSVVALFCFALVFLTTTVVVPAEERKQRTIRFSTRVLMTVALAILSGFFWVPELVSFVAPENVLAQEIAKIAQPNNAAMVLAAVLIGHLALVYLMRDRTAMGRVQKPIEEEFRDLHFSERLQIFCEELKSDLLVLDRDLRWNVTHFVPLDAEVEIISRQRRSRKVMDLLHALKQIRTARIMLVLGVPGSGKSVALRKLCVDLIGESIGSGRIPVYVNLKEWLPKRTWTSNEPPTDEDFKEFAYKNVKSRLSDQTKPFFDDYFHRMVGRGRIFFVLDSFDEIPGILDADETSVLLEKLSDLLVKFLKSGYESRGIIASRYYRRPQIAADDRGVLEIRPFSELQISRAIQNAAADSPRLIKALFDERPDLGAAARNPFILSLILKYVSKHKALPDKQAELFSSYIEDSLELAEENTMECGLSNDDLRSAMQAASWTMFASERFGLEMPVALLREKLPDYKIDDVVDILQAARLARVGAPNRVFSFVHRRFNEYFLVHRFLADPDTAPLEAIPEDSRWRDAMVLYAEVADDDTAFRIAEYCWREVRSLNTTSVFENRDQYFRSLHSLRFLIEAFRGRRSAIESFHAELGDQVLKFAREEKDLVSTKHAVEAIGLLRDSQAQPILITAMEKHNEWITETSLRACRYITKLSPEAQKALIAYIRSIPPYQLLKRNRELSFSLESAEIYNPIARAFKIHRADTIIAVAAAVIFTATAPIIAIIGVTVTWFAIFLTTIILNPIIVRSIISIGRVHSSNARSKTPTPFPVGLVVKGIQSFLKILRFKEITSIDTILLLYRIFPIFLIYLGLSRMSSYLFGDAEPISIDEMFNAVQIHDLTEYFGVNPFFVLAVIAFVLLIPWVHIIYLGSNFVESIFSNLSSLSLGTVIRNCLMVILAFSILGLLGYLLLNFVPEIVILGLGVLGGVAAAIFIVASVIASGRSYVADRAKFVSATRVFAADREIIGRNFSALESTGFRLRYARWVETHSGDHLKALGDPTNIWPNNERPYVGNDAGSTLLAQLDARWFKLDV